MKLGLVCFLSIAVISLANGKDVTDKGKREAQQTWTNGKLEYSIFPFFSGQIILNCHYSNPFLMNTFAPSFSNLSSIVWYELPFFIFKHFFHNLWMIIFYWWKIVLQLLRSDKGQALLLPHHGLNHQSVSLGRLLKRSGNQ